MNKKFIVSGASCILAAGLLAFGAVCYQKSNSIAYGTYSAETPDEKNSYITLDSEHISFTNVDFETAENQEAAIVAVNEKKYNSTVESDEERIRTDEEKRNEFENNHIKLLERIEEIQKDLDFSSVFNNKTFDATNYETQEDGSKELIVYDEETGTELYLTVSAKKDTIQCGDVVFKYKGN